MVVMKLLRPLTSLPTFYTNHPTRIHLLLLTLLGLPALWPLAVVILPATGDGNLHLMRLTVLDRYLARGEIYPRWAAELALGYGHPVFTYYAPSTYALLELFHGLGITHVQGYRLAIALFILLAGYGMYALARTIYHPSRAAGWLALVAATAYMYAPYFLTTAHFRGALAETGAQALLPWLLWSFRRLYCSHIPSRYFLVATLTLGALAVTHNITLLFFPFVLVGYGGALWLDDARAPRVRLQRLGWMGAACLSAMGITLFFWLPMAIERHYLSNFSYAVSRTLVHYHVWDWSNFLDWRWHFAYTDKAPFPLGLVHTGLALLGVSALLLRRSAKRWEWWYWLGVTTVVLLGMTRLAEPIWLSNQYLLITQFPWRLLTFISLTFALFTGTLMTLVTQRWQQALSVGVLLALIILANRPTTATLATTPAYDLNVSLPAVNHYELDSGAYGASLGREFMPRDTDDFVITDVPATQALASEPTITLQGADAHSVKLQIDTASALKLRFTNFYFPGWQAILDGATAQAQEVAIYPTTRQAVATMEIPAGQHTLDYRWEGTTLQWWSTYLTLATLFGLALYVLVYAPHSLGGRWSAALPLLLCCGGGWATMRPAPVAPPPLLPAVATVAPGLRMLGYYVERAEEDKLFLWPYWFVQQPQPDLTLRWSLIDATGKLVTETTAYPYFNTQHANGWSAGMVVDDAYQLPLPPGLAAGQYTLQLQPMVERQPQHAVQTVGVLQVAAAPAAPPISMRTVGFRFEEEAYLDGYALKVNRRLLPVDAPAIPVVHPADTVELTLYWRAQRAILENYHSFIHLIDWRRQTLRQHDQLPGPFWSAPMLWNRYTPLPDIYRFTIPNDAANGLYYPRVGLYRFTRQDFSAQDRLLIFDAAGAELGDGVDLPPIKIYNPNQENPVAQSTTPVHATFAGLATLTGYQLTPATTTLTAGESLTVTLVYKSNGPAQHDYTQFIQLYAPPVGLVGQIDREPLAGGNPTSVWVAGETIVETVAFVTNADAPPGLYRLQMGFYDRNTGTRLSVTDAAGAALPDQTVLLTELQLTAPQTIASPDHKEVGDDHP